MMFIYHSEAVYGASVQRLGELQYTVISVRVSLRGALFRLSGSHHRLLRTRMEFEAGFSCI